MEPILTFLQRRLKAAGPGRWPQIAEIASAKLADGDRISFHLLRKLAYGDRENPGIKYVQPLLDFFDEVDRGLRDMPEPLPVEAA